MKNVKVISKEDLRKMEKSAHRLALIELGMYSIPTHKVFKSKKEYTRKSKFKDVD
jgi:hypothetical protein